MDVGNTICLNCGKPGEGLLCADCRTEAALDSAFNALLYFRPETCQNEYILKLASEYDNPFEVRDLIPELLELFSADITDYYWCRYLKSIKSKSYEARALQYLNTHPLGDKKTQVVLKDLLDTWLRNDFVKPEEWCDRIAVKQGLCCELYYQAAQFYAMTGEYDKADEIIDYALGLCNDPSYNAFLYYDSETEIRSLSKLKQDNERYRTKKPYWPSTEERRAAITVIYDKKGIPYTKSPAKRTSWHNKIKESDFAPIQEYVGETPDTYCAFWCEDVFVKPGLSCVYQIAAVKVKEKKIVDTFQSYIYPWDGRNCLENAAKKAKIDDNVLEQAEKVAQVMPKFFGFVGNDILVSTGALGDQAKLISRAARYSKMAKIDNKFFDVLDYAADVSSKFDLQNNTRAFLIEYFGLTEGNDALEKARINVTIMNCLKEMDQP